MGCGQDVNEKLCFEGRGGWYYGGYIYIILFKFYIIRITQCDVYFIDEAIESEGIQEGYVICKSWGLEQVFV